MKNQRIFKIQFKYLFEITLIFKLHLLKGFIYQHNEIQWLWLRSIIYIQ